MCKIQLTDLKNAQNAAKNKDFAILPIQTDQLYNPKWPPQMEQVLLHKYMHNNR